MDYKGTIIEESLDDTSCLKDVRIVSTKIEQVNEKHKTPWLKQWTLHVVTIPEARAEQIAKQMSQAIDRAHFSSWYADFKNDKYHFIIYRNKVFKVDRKNPLLYKDAKYYGVSIGIPEYQLVF